MIRTTRSMVNLDEIAKRVRPDDMVYWKAFLERRQRYLQRVNAFPAEQPKIDWVFYKENVATRAVQGVQDMSVAYNNFKVPFPADPQTSLLEQQRILTEKEIKEFVAASLLRMDKHRCDKEFLESIPPFEDMTYEEYAELFPEVAPNFIERPTFWPHTADEQPEEEKECPIDDNKPELKKVAKEA